MLAGAPEVDDVVAVVCEQQADILLACDNDEYIAIEIKAHEAPLTRSATLNVVRSFVCAEVEFGTSYRHFNLRTISGFTRFGDELETASHDVREGLTTPEAKARVDSAVNVIDPGRNGSGTSSSTRSASYGSTPISPSGRTSAVGYDSRSKTSWAGTGLARRPRRSQSLNSPRALGKPALPPPEAKQRRSRRTRTTTAATSRCGGAAWTNALFAACWPRMPRRVAHSAVQRPRP